MTNAFQQSPPEQLFAALQEMQTGVRQLVETDSARREEMEFLADVRQKLVEGLTILHEQLLEVLQGVHLLMTPPAQTPIPWWRKWVAYASGFGVGSVLIVGAWLCWPTSPYKAFAIEVNGVLKQRFEQFPPAVQEQLRAVYRAHQFVEPGQRGSR